MGKIVTLGEIMLRLSSSSGVRLEQSEAFSVHYGGGEANVAISLANYGHEVTFASKVPANSIGAAVKKHLQRYDVQTNQVLVGGQRLGTYYVEAGIGERAANVVYDRSGSSFADISEIEWNTAKLFNGIDIFHISGITPALSLTWQEMTLQLIQRAKQAGCQISFDINYRGKLWSQADAGKAIKRMLPYVDFCSAGKLDAIHLLGINSDNSLKEATEYYYQEIQKLFPNISVLYSTNRQVLSASVNFLTGMLWMDQKYYQSKCHEINPIVDRVGGGDAFAGGVLHGILEQKKPQEIIDFATAASAMKHTIYGDCNQFNQHEVQEFLTSESGKIKR